MSQDYRILKCLTCDGTQIVGATEELTWKCRDCGSTQTLGKVYFRSCCLRMCEFYLEYVVHKKTHTCDVIYDGEHPSTSKGVVKNILFKPVAGNQDEYPVPLETFKHDDSFNMKFVTSADPEPVVTDQGMEDNYKENKRKNVEIEAYEGEDFVHYVHRKLKACYEFHTNNQNIGSLK